VLNLISMSLISGWTHVVRKEPRIDKMWPGPASRVVQARRLCLVGLLLLNHVTTPLTPMMRSMMSVSSIRGMLPRSVVITMPFGTPRGQSKTLSTPTVKLLCRKAASSPWILGFGLFSILIGTTLSTFTRKLQWCQPRR
jgi:hypothetical protein